MSCKLVYLYIGPINYSEPASIIPQSFLYYRFILNVTERWKDEKVHLRSIRHYLSSYCGGAIITACEENSYEGLFLAIIQEKEPISLMLLEEIAKKIHSDATVHLVKQYKSRLETTSRCSPATTSNVWDRLEPQVTYPWVKLASGGPSPYRSTPDVVTSQYSRRTTPEAMLPQYRSTPGVVSEYEERSPKVKKAKLCSYGPSFQF